MKALIRLGAHPALKIARCRFRHAAQQRSLKPAAIVSLILLSTSVFLGQNDVLTQHNDVARTGQNLNETLLTPANVNVNQFGKLFGQSLDGISVGQPLYVSNLLMADGLVHNVVFVTTQHNTVYAFDADNNMGSNAAPIWSVSLNAGGTPDPIADYGCTGTGYKEIGITSTPVIDDARSTMYVVAKTVTPDGDRLFSLHALDLTDGSEKLGGPVSITGSYGPDNFLIVYQIQRPALLLENGSVYVGFGGNGCDLYDYNGWLFVYDAQSLQQQAVFEIAPNGKKSSIWQGGSGPAADQFGNIYVATANGTYDGPGENDYGDSVLKLGWNGNNFGILDYFTPFNQLDLQKNNEDLGSSGPLILPDQPGLYPHELIAGGKGRTLYLVNRDDLGQYNPDMDDVVQSFPSVSAFEITGVPSYWNSNVYLAADHDYIKQFALVNGILTSQPVTQTTVYFGGTGVASTSISANGTSNAILWALAHSSAILYAFDATNLAKVLYNSKQAQQERDKLSALVRFVTPTVSNGKVYVPGKTELSVFGLLPSLAATGGNNQAGDPKEVLPIPLSILASDPYTQAPFSGVAVTCSDNRAGGSFIPSATMLTDDSGTASFNYQLPRNPQSITITCSSPKFSSASFSETCSAGAPATIKLLSGNRQAAPTNTTLPKPLVVKIIDANKFPVPGITVTFNDNGAGGSFSLPSSMTDSKGEVSTFYTTGPNPGKVSVIVSSAGLSPKSFVETVE